MTAVPRVFDLTRPLHHMGFSTSSQPVPMMWPTLTHEDSSKSFEGDFSIASMGLLLSDHAGTHVDAWSHLSSDPDAAAIDAMPIGAFIGRGVVLDARSVPPGGLVGAGSLSDVELPSGTDTVLVRTDAYSDTSRDRDAYLHRFPGLGSDLIHALANRGVRIIGTDVRSIDLSADESGSQGLPAHRACLERGVVVYENLLINDGLEGQHFLFVGLPLRLTGATGSPVRAVALLDSCEVHAERTSAREVSG